jgi:hypothetical protein
MPRKAAPRCDGLTDDELVTYDLLPVAPPAPLAPADQCYQPGRRYVGIAPTASARQRVAEADNVVPLPRERSAGSRTIVLLKLFFERWRTLPGRNSAILAILIASAERAGAGFATVCGC